MWAAQCESSGRYLKEFGPGRVTFVLDKAGVVIGIYDDLMHAEPHIEEALRALAN